MKVAKALPLPPCRVNVLVISGGTEYKEYSALYDFKTRFVCSIMIYAKWSVYEGVDYSFVLQDYVPKSTSVDLDLPTELEDYPNQDTPVIVLTANAVTGAREMYLEEGFDDFLSKPIASEKLEKMLRNGEFNF